MNTCLINNSERNKRTTSSLVVCPLSGNSPPGQEAPPWATEPLSHWTTDPSEPMDMLANMKTRLKSIQMWGHKCCPWVLLCVLEYLVLLTSVRLSVGLSVRLNTICGSFIEISTDHCLAASSAFCCLIKRLTNYEPCNQIREQHEQIYNTEQENAFSKTKNLTNETIDKSC